MARSGCAVSTARHVSDEFPDARHFLDRPADSTQPPGALRPESLVDPHSVSVRGLDYAVLDYAAGPVHRLPSGTAGVLGEHSASGVDALLQLGMRDRKGIGEERSRA